MKIEEIQALFQQFEAVASEYEGVECWSARDMQTLLGYSKWENFAKVIEKAKLAYIFHFGCANIQRLTLPSSSVEAARPSPSPTTTPS